MDAEFRRLMRTWADQRHDRPQGDPGALRRHARHSPINLGQYLNAGDPIVPLQMMDPIHINFSLPQQDMSSLKIGAEVKVSAEGVKVAQPIGKITAVNSVIDEATRNVEVQATLANPDGSLRPGMFVDVQIMLGTGEPVIALPASAINFAPYGNSVFIVGEMTDPKGPTRGVRHSS